jgi:restriction system protein
MLPLLQHVSDGAEYSLAHVVDALADHFNLTKEARTEFLPSGSQLVFHNRIGWARSYLKKAGLIDSTRRGFFNISERGIKVLQSSPAEINVKYLEQFPEFIAFRSPSKPDEIRDIAPINHASQTPEEVLELAHQRIQLDLAQEVLDRILSCSPAFFENLVVALLVKMGYGGSRKDAGERIGQTGDGGIDGIIKEDRLGLDAIYIQAKRWQGSVGRPEIQKFVGALQGQRARKGVFITTSVFTTEATSYANNIETKVVLIDGKLLASLMIDFNVGVTPSASYIVKKIDSDYFEET